MQNRSTGYETVGSTGKKVRFKSLTTLVVSAVGDDVGVAESSPRPSRPREAKQAKVKGRVTDRNGKSMPDVRVLFRVPGSNEVLAMVTAADGTYEGKSPVGSITVRVAHRTVGSDGKPKVVILLDKQVDVPAEGKTLDLVTQREIRK